MDTLVVLRLLNGEELIGKTESKSIDTIWYLTDVCKMGYRELDDGAVECAIMPYMAAAVNTGLNQQLSIKDAHVICNYEPNAGVRSLYERQITAMNAGQNPTGIQNLMETKISDV